MSERFECDGCRRQVPARVGSLVGTASGATQLSDPPDDWIMVVVAPCGGVRKGTRTVSKVLHACQPACAARALEDWANGQPHLDLEPPEPRSPVDQALRADA